MALGSEFVRGVLGNGRDMFGNSRDILGNPRDKFACYENKLLTHVSSQNQFTASYTRNTCIAKPLEARGSSPVKCQGWEGGREIESSQLCNWGGQFSTPTLILEGEMYLVFAVRPHQKITLSVFGMGLSANSRKNKRNC